MQIEVILYLLVAHFIGDFILQSDAMAKGKSKSSRILLIHVLAYTLPFIVLAIVLPSTISETTFLGFLVFNIVAHFATDYVTSRVTSKLWAEGEVHEFFVVIGFDQLIHIVTLVLSFHYVQGM